MQRLWLLTAILALTGSAPATPVWALERTVPANIGEDQADVNAILDHDFSDQAVQAAVLVKLGYVIGERYEANHTSTDLGTELVGRKKFL
jgi:hypothetical protein